MHLAHRHLVADGAAQAVRSTCASVGDASTTSCLDLRPSDRRPQASPPGNPRPAPATVPSAGPQQTGRHVITTALSAKHPWSSFPGLEEPNSRPQLPATAHQLALSSGRAASGASSRSYQSRSFASRKAEPRNSTSVSSSSEPPEPQGALQYGYAFRNPIKLEHEYVPISYHMLQASSRPSIWTSLVAGCPSPARSP